MLIFTYFRRPFPSRQGFAAYRIPGPVLHVPLILAAIMAGGYLCWPHLYTRPLILVWLLAGIYLGREYTIFSHYAPPLTLLGWAAFVAMIAEGPRLRILGLERPSLSATVSVALLVALVLVAWRFTRPEEK